MAHPEDISGRSRLALSGAPWAETDREAAKLFSACAAMATFGRAASMPSQLARMVAGERPLFASGIVIDLSKPVRLFFSRANILAGAGKAAERRDRWRKEGMAYLKSDNNLLFAGFFLITKGEGIIENNTIRAGDGWHLHRLPDGVMVAGSIISGGELFLEGIDYLSGNGVLAIPEPVAERIGKAALISRAEMSAEWLYDFVFGSNGTNPADAEMAVARGCGSPDVMAAAAASDAGYVYFRQHGLITKVTRLPSGGAAYWTDSGEYLEAAYPHSRFSEGRTVRRWEVVGDVIKAHWARPGAPEKWWKFCSALPSGLWLKPSCGLNLTVPNGPGRVEAYAKTNNVLHCIFPLIGDSDDAARFFASAADAETITGESMAARMGMEEIGDYRDVPNLVDVFLMNGAGSARAAIYEFGQDAVDPEAMLNFIQEHAGYVRVFACPPL